MTVLRFGRFELDTAQRKLTESGNVLQLGGKAFDILAVLATSAGEVVSKETLLAAVWPDTTVEEGALRVHLVTLRKLLGDRTSGRYIENVPGRGYVFVMPVEGSGVGSVNQAPAKPQVLQQSFPRLTERLIGRDDFVAETAQMLSTNRLVTISGAGGVGKTSVALAAAEIISAAREVLFVDLASLSDEKQIAPTVASLLGLSVVIDNAEHAVLEALAERNLLLLLDNCEHIISKAAFIVEDILAAAKQVTVLATSREPLRIAGERIRQLPSLPVPPEDSPQSSLLKYPAVELFVDRVMLSSELEDFNNPETLAAAASIVRRLDGIPLAIELAASGVANLGLAHLVSSLSDPLAVLRRGRRTAPPRQQTLRATLDWSFDGLTDKERLLFEYCAMFASAFSTEAAQTLCAGVMPEEDFYEAFDGLFLKSLFSVSGGDGKYRLLQTTRSYALDKVRRGDQARLLHAAHADYCEKALANAARDWPTLATADWMRLYSDLIHDIRSAIHWSFESIETAESGMRLAANSKILWVQLGLMNEQIQVLDEALKRVPGSAHEGTETELDLRISKGSALYHVQGYSKDGDALYEIDRGIEIAEAIGNLGKCIQANAARTAILCSHGRYQDAIDAALALRDKNPQVSSHVFSAMLGHNYFFNGELSRARKEIEGSLDDGSGSIRRTSNAGLGFDQRISGLAVLVFVEFLEGNMVTAMDLLKESVREAEDLGYSIASCLLLMLSAFPMASLVGRHSEASEYLDKAEGLAKQQRLIRWQQWISSYRNGLFGDDNHGGLEKELSGAAALRLEYFVVIAGERARKTHIERALQGDAGWCRPELLRLLAIAEFPTNPELARKIAADAVALSRKMVATFWELRCLMAAYELSSRSDQPGIIDDIEAVIGKFEPGSKTIDLEAATDLIRLAPCRNGLTLESDSAS